MMYVLDQAHQPRELRTIFLDVPRELRGCLSEIEMVVVRNLDIAVVATLIYDKKMAENHRPGEPNAAQIPP